MAHRPAKSVVNGPSTTLARPQLARAKAAADPLPIVRLDATAQSYSYSVTAGRGRPANTRAPMPVARTGTWRRRAAGTVMVCAAYGLPVAVTQLPQMSWHWFGSVWFVYGEPVSLLPGVVLVALLAPLVAYRRRDAVTLFFPLGGVRVAWIIGTRLGQLPHRTWPVRTDDIPLHGRRATRFAVAVRSHSLWRESRAKRGSTPADGAGLMPSSRAPSAPLPPADQTTPSIR
jgi:hypothetical protein